MPELLYGLMELHMKDVPTVLYEPMELPGKVPRLLYGLMELHIKNVPTVLCGPIELPGNRSLCSCMGSWSCI